METPAEQYQTIMIPLKDVFSDDDFNCRSEITDASVMTLAQSIEIHGLQSPIQLQCKEGLPWGRQYRIISGHRRYVATKLLGQTYIKATVVEIVNEQQAKLLNLSENIDRKNLTPYEEALALANIFPPDTSNLKMAKVLKRSREWCRRRMMILKYPADVQMGFHVGLLGIRDAIVLDSLLEGTRTDAARRLMVRRQDKNDIPMGTVKQRVPHRSTTDIKKLADYFLRKKIDGLTVKVLLWVLGAVDTPTIKAMTRDAEQDNKKALYLDDT